MEYKEINKYKEVCIELICISTTDYTKKDTV